MKNVAHNELNERVSLTHSVGSATSLPFLIKRVTPVVAEGLGRGANSFVAGSKVRLTNCQAMHFAVFIFILPDAMQGAGGEGVESKKLEIN